MCFPLQLRFRAICLSACLCAGPTAAAPPCDGTLEPVRGKVGYQARGELRCEGLYASDVSRPAGGLELVALTRGVLRFDPATQTSVRLAPVAADGPVRGRGGGIPVKTYYRLDALIPAGGALDWGLTDVVRPVPLGAEQIGLVAHLESEPRLYLPLALAGQGGAGPVTLLLRPGAAATGLWWRSAPRTGDGCGAMSAWRELDHQGPLDPGFPARLPLPDDVAGELCLEAQAVAQRGGRRLRGLWQIRTGL